MSGRESELSVGNVSAECSSSAVGSCPESSELSSGFCASFAGEGAEDGADVGFGVSPLTVGAVAVFFFFYKRVVHFDNQHR